MDPDIRSQSEAKGLKRMDAELDPDTVHPLGPS